MSLRMCSSHPKSSLKQQPKIHHGLLALPWILQQTAHLSPQPGLTFPNLSLLWPCHKEYHLRDKILQSSLARHKSHHFLAPADQFDLNFQHSPLEICILATSNYLRGPWTRPALGPLCLAYTLPSPLCWQLGKLLLVLLVLTQVLSLLSLFLDTCPWAERPLSVHLISQVTIYNVYFCNCFVSSSK